MKHASRSNYTMTHGEEELLREAELNYASKMYAASLISSEHAAASSAFPSQSLHAFRSRQAATHTTNCVFQKPVPNAALGQQMVRIALAIDTPTATFTVLMRLPVRLDTWRARIHRSHGGASRLNLPLVADDGEGWR
jgi:hypothetical protein